MPGKDGTGPKGKGPKTGNKQGRCGRKGRNAASEERAGKGRGYGRGSEQGMGKGKGSGQGRRKNK